MKKTNIGGQAVIEGIMMRGLKTTVLAVRKPNNEIFTEKTENAAGRRGGFSRLPIVRGVYAFIDSLVIGTRVLMHSAEIAEEGIDLSEEEPKGFDKFLVDKFGDKLNDYIIYFSVFISVIFSVALFMLLPVFLGSFFKNVVSTAFLGVIEGLARITIFLGYLFLISRMKEIKRLFAYHGAEHKTISCFEAGDELTPENVAKHSRLHKRCGTSFLLIVMVVSMFVLFFVQTDSIAVRFLSRIVLLPLIAGLSYEVIKWAGNSDSKFVAVVSYPGLLLQKMTTCEPDFSQIEVAIAAMKGVLEDETGL